MDNCQLRNPFGKKTTGKELTGKLLFIAPKNAVYGDPRFDRRFLEMNAKEAAQEWIKHTYHNGYSLPEMPK